MKHLFKFFSRIISQWRGSLHFRHTILLSGIILLLMTVLAFIMLSKQRSALYLAAEAKGMAYTQAFAMGGWAAIKNNLYRLQESMMNTPRDPNVLGIEVIDPDHMILASLIPARIGQSLNDPILGYMTGGNRETFQYTQGEQGEPRLLMVAPISDQGETKAWIRIIFSLADVQREEQQLIWRMTFMTLLLMAAGILSVHRSQKKFSATLGSVIDQLQTTLTQPTLTTETFVQEEIQSNHLAQGRPLLPGKLEQLEETITQTVRRLKNQSQALQDSTLMLEQKVEDRTKDLMYAKLSLESEIQERRLIQEQLEHLSRHNELILNSAGEGIYGLDMAGQVTFINPAGAAFLGYHVQELIGQSMHDTMHHTKPEGSDYPEASCPLHGDFRQGLSHHSKHEVFWKKDGTMFPVEYTSTPIHEQNRILGAVVTFVDITLRQEAEKKIRESEVRVRQSQKMEAIGTLAGGIAHDFNNILTALLGYSQLAQITISTENPGYHHLDQVLNAGKRAQDLVKQILTFSRQSEQERTPIELRAIVQEVLRLIQATLPSSIEIHHQVFKESGVVLADSTQLHQVLINLFTNAEYAMRGRHGDIFIDLHNLQIAKEDLTKYPTLTPGPYLQLTIRDSGPGIPSDLLPRIFDPFFTTKDVGEGTGLGLAVAHGIITSHGGTVTVESQIGEGTSFEILLPQITASPNPIPKPPRSQRTQQDEHILLVDDEESLSLMGQHFLEHLGYRVTTCTNGLAALEQFRSSPKQFDAVITDQTMPKITGDRLATELLHIRPDLPIILYTGFSYTLTPEKAQKIGIRRLLMKPLHLQDLAKALEEIFLSPPHLQ